MLPHTNSFKNSQDCFSLSSQRALEAVYSSRCVKLALSFNDFIARMTVNNSNFYYMKHDGIMQSPLPLSLFCSCEINIIMHNVSQFPIVEMPPARPFFKKGQFYNNFYFLEDGKASVTINQVSLEVSAPIFIGDYEILIDIQYRTTMIKSITKCKIRLIPTHQYSKIKNYRGELIQAFEQYKLKSKLLKYWLTTLFVVSIHKKNEVVNCQNAIGVVLEGQFKHDSHIPIVQMKEKNFQLLRKFEISIIGQNEIFEENVACETYRGMTAILEQKYIAQLTGKFEEFSRILEVSTSKKHMHLSMSKEIAKNCKKRRSLFEHMVPTTFKDSIKHEQYEERSANSSDTRNSKEELSRLRCSDDVYSIKDNISQFLHKQWRRGLSLKLPRKEKGTLILQRLKIDKSRKSKQLQDFKNPEMINLSIPRSFKEVKFNFKMLLKTKGHHNMQSRRFVTEPAEPHRKLLFDE